MPINESRKVPIHCSSTGRAKPSSKATRTLAGLLLNHSATLHLASAPLPSDPAPHCPAFAASSVACGSAFFVLVAPLYGWELQYPGRLGVPGDAARGGGPNTGGASRSQLEAGRPGVAIK